MGKKLTKEQVNERIDLVKSNNSARNALFDVDEQYYELAFIGDLGLPLEYVQDGIVLPTARDIVDSGTAHISTAYARFYRPALGTDETAHHQAEMLRKFDTGMFYMTKMESPISPWHDANKNAFKHGMWCFETLYDPYKGGLEPEQDDDEADEDFAKRKKLWNAEKRNFVPISIRSVHPRNVYPDSAINPTCIVIEESKLVAQAALDWPKWYAKQMEVPDPKMKPTSIVTQTLYWDSEVRSAKINNDFVDDLPEEVNRHDYGFWPYVIGYSGFGSTDATATPEKRAVGLIRYLRGLLRSESFAYSVYNIVMKAHAWPITFVSGPGAAALTQIKLTLGKIYEKTAGTTIEEYVKAPPPELVLQHMIYTNSALSASAAPKSLQGLGESGVRSAVDRQTVISQGQLKYQSVLEQMQLSTAKVVSNCTKIAERCVPEAVHLWVHTPTEQIDMTLDKSEIDGHYVTYCEFTPSSPEEEARRHADMMNLQKTGSISADTGRRRYLPSVDPEQEEILVEAERLRATPEVQKLMASIASSELISEVEKINKMKMLKAGMFAGQNVTLGEGMQAPAPTPDGQPPAQGGQPLSMQGGAQQMSVGMRQNPGQSNPAIPPEVMQQMMMRARNSRAPVRPGVAPFGAGAT